MSKKTYIVFSFVLSFLEFAVTCALKLYSSRNILLMLFVKPWTLLSSAQCVFTELNNDGKIYWRTLLLTIENLKVNGSCLRHMVIIVHISPDSWYFSLCDVSVIYISLPLLNVESRPLGVIIISATHSPLECIKGNAFCEQSRY